MLKIKASFICDKSKIYDYMGIGNQLKIIGKSSVSIIYPNFCAGCSVDLKSNEEHLCLTCLNELPYMSNNQIDMDKLDQLFWGRHEVQKIFSLFNYQKGNQVQQLLHLIKYQKRTQLANYLGMQLGQTIKDCQLDFIIPIPLHKKKQKIRGFNQSTVISKGVSKIVNVPVNENLVKRIVHNPTQTSVGKYERWSNVRDIFSIHKPQKLIDKHVLLVDDVLTTGATIEACVKQLLKIENCKVSVATLAARV